MNQARKCHHCGAPDYGTPFCPSCQSPMVRAPGDPQPAGVEAGEVALEAAGFFRRFFALMTDYLIVGIAADLVGFAYRLGTGGTGPVLPMKASLAISFALFTAYCTILLGENGQTLGKRLFGIRVVRSGGGPVTYTRAFWRTLLYALSWQPLFLGLGFLWALWDRRKQTWHDKIVDTVVIRRPRAKS